MEEWNNQMRIDGRLPDELRPIKIQRNFTNNAPGSVLIQAGSTKILCTASIEDAVPLHRKGTGQGWVTAEYSLLPGSTPKRTARDRSSSKISGRTYEIQRLIGRSMRSVVRLGALGERTIWVDCDVLEADGGTRTIAITGGYMALADALYWMKRKEMITEMPLLGSVAAISVGIVDGICMLDLCYAEDSNAEVDMNIVSTGSGEFVEIQGSGEQKTFSEKQLIEMLNHARKGIKELTAIQLNTLETG